MPTGYTCIIEDNEAEPTFEAFALRCARNFGATTHQRDEDVDPYYRDEVAKAEAVLEHARKVTDGELLVAIAESNRQRSEDNERYRKEHERKQGRYLRMIEKLIYWEPPGPGHVGLKTFMTEQIALCYKSNERPYEIPEGPQTPGAFRAQMIDDAERSLAWRKERLETETHNARVSAEWLQKLRASLTEYGK